jgi:hypothetical protein
MKWSPQKNYKNKNLTIFGYQSDPIPIMAAVVSDFIKEVWERYQKIVRENPETVSQLEATFKVVSYVIAGNMLVDGLSSLQKV